MGPLHGRRIAITRREEDSLALKSALEELGAKVSIHPAIRRAPPSDHRMLDEGIRNLGRGHYQGLLFTSPAAVREWAKRCATLGISPPPDLFIGAVGPGTGLAAKELGLSPTVIPSRHDGVALAKAVAKALGRRVEGMRFLQPRAEEGRRELSSLLGESGAMVDVVAAYRTVPATEASLRPLVDELMAGRLDAAVFASPSAVHALEGASRERGVGALIGRAVAVAIGDTTAGALLSAGVERVSRAKEATDKGIVDACVETLAPR